MSDATARPWALRLPWGLIGVLALVVPVEWYVAGNPQRFMTTIEMDWRVVGKEAAAVAPGVDVLCFGDSMLKFGLAPNVLEDRLGRSVYSLAVMDGKPAASFFLLRRAIEAGARPRLVLVDYQPECMCEASDHLLRNQHWKAMLSARECLEMLWTYRDPDFFARTVLARVLPSVRCRNAIRKDVVLGLDGKAVSNPEENAKTARNRSLNRGALLLARNPRYSGDVPAAYGKNMFTDDWFGRPEHTSYVRRFMALAARHDIPVVWILPPNAPEVERIRERIGMHDRYTRYVEAVQRRYPNLHVIDARRPGFDHSAFVDPVHLDREGAAAFTLEVAEVLRALLDRQARIGKWMEITHIRKQDAMIALEDVEQSGQRLSPAPTIRR
jgi:Protein of unknown function (DUF1574)